MKTCPKCGIGKDECEFSRNKNKRDGLCSRCKSCSAEKTRAWSAANKDRKKASTASWEAANKDRLKEMRSKYHAARYAADPQRFLSRNAAYRSENKDALRILSAKWRQENKDRIKATREKWEKENPTASRIKAQNYRARKRVAGGVLSAGLANKLFVLQRGRCACCGEPLENDYHLDHIMPLALGGQNIDSNIQLLRSICNRIKHSKHPVDFMQQRGFLI